MQNNLDKKLYVIAGPNGCGKSTFAKELLSSFSIQFLNADDIYKELNNSEHDASRINAGKIFFERYDNLVKTEQSFAIETTLSGVNYKPRLEELLENDYYITTYYIFLQNYQSALKRIKIRVKAGGHNVPEADVIRRFHRSKINFWNIYKNLSDEWYLLDNSYETFNEIAFGKNDKFNIVNDKVFNIFIDEVR